MRKRTHLPKIWQTNENQRDLSMADTIVATVSAEISSRIIDKPELAA